MSTSNHQASNHTEIDDRGADFDFIDEEFTRYCRVNETKIENDELSAPERVPTPDSLRHKLDTIYLTREDVQRLNLPKDYPLLSDAERAKLGALEFNDDFKRRLQALDDTILDHRRGLESCPSGDSRRPMALYALSSSLYERYRDMLRDDRDLNESVERTREALVLCSEDDSSRPLMLSNLSQCLRQPIDGNEGDARLDEVIELGKQSLDLTSATPLRCEFASRLADTYVLRFRKSRQAGDLDLAFQLSSMALDMALAGGAAHHMALVALASCYRFKSLLNGELQCIDRALDLAEEALKVGPPCRNQRWQSHHRLGLILKTRGIFCGELRDLERATTMFQQALALSPLQPYARSQLASCLAERYSTFLQHDDLELAAAQCLHGLQLRSLPMAMRSEFLYRLGSVFGDKHTQYRAVADIDRAVAYFRCATWCQEPMLSRDIPVVTWTNLCDSLSDRYAATGNMQDLEEAVGLQCQIIALQPFDTFVNEAVITCFAQIAAAKYKQLRDCDAFDQVTHWCQQTSSGTLIASKDVWIRSITLAACHLARFQDSRNTEHLLEAKRLYLVATDASSGSAAYTFMLTLHWIEEINSFKLPEEAFDAYTNAIRLLPRIAYMGHDQRSRLQVLARSSTLSTDSAACALSLGRTLQAVELSEAGRAVFWSQVLRARTPLDGLPTQLSSRLLGISLELETGNLPAPTGTSRSMHEGRFGNELFDRQRLSEEFDSLVSQARLLPGFEHFLKPKSFASLVQVAKCGPVVILIASAVYGCGAIVIKPGCTAPKHVALPDVTVETVQKHSSVLSRANQEAREALRHLKPKEEDEKKSSREGSGSVLAAMWTMVVKPVVEALELKKSTDDSRPRVWWCLTGPFVFLPIHAAGIYGEVTDCTSDYMISSYTPTLDALIISRECTPVINNALLVAEPFAPHQSQLPKTAFEIDHVATSLPPEVLRVIKGNVTSLADSNIATVDWTTKALPDFSVVHLACHGHQDQRNPLQSGFYLRDGNLTLEKIMKLKLPNAFFAFLSACESASGDRERPDETIHLAASMLFAGFRSIVATMWTMEDEDGPKVAHEVYKELFKTYPVIDPDAIPRALDSAVRKLRAQGASPSRWATYVHMGC